MDEHRELIQRAIDGRRKWLAIPICACGGGDDCTHAENRMLDEWINVADGFGDLGADDPALRAALDADEGEQLRGRED